MKNRNFTAKSKSLIFCFYVVVTMAFPQYILSQETLIGEYEFTTGINQLKATNVATGVLLSDIYINSAKVTASYVNDALETTQWTTSMGISGGRSIQFNITKLDDINGFKISKVNLTLKRTGPANRLQLNYGIGINPTGKTFSNYNTYGTSTYSVYSLTENTGTDLTDIPAVTNNSPQYFAIATIATSTSEIVTIDKIEVYGTVYSNNDTVPVNYIEKTVNIFPNESLRPINPLFWGTNFLFWIEDDASLADGVIEKKLKEMPCTILRYPGGTVADNFHWKTNTLDNINRFPYADGAEKSDFDEFMNFCQKVNAEPMLVVNTESWVTKQDIEGGAKEASDWVQYCKDKGYKVKYWEIGNETYWHPIMTAAEYGDIVKIYSKAMKAVDTEIIISANGHWDKNMVGTKERIKSSEWENLRLKYLNIASKADAKAADNYTDSLKNKDITYGNSKWWNNVAEKCADDIDMISLHWYFSGADNMATMTDEVNNIQAIFSAKNPGKKYLTAMTEYNCNNDNNYNRISGLIVGIGRFLTAGVDIGNFWPMRNGVNGETGSMFTKEALEPGYPYQVLKLFSTNLKGNLVKCEYDNTIFPFASFDGKQLTIVLSGRGVISDAVRATLNIEGLSDFELIDAITYEPGSGVKVPVNMDSSPATVTIDSKGCTCIVNPYNTVILRFRKK